MRTVRLVASGECIDGTQAQVDGFFQPQTAGAHGALVAGVELHHVQGKVVHELQPAAQDNSGAVVDRHAGTLQHPFEIIRGIIREVLTAGDGDSGHHEEVRAQCVAQGLFGVFLMLA